MNPILLAALFATSAALPSTRPSPVVPDKRASASADPEPSVVPHERKRHWAPAFAGATRVWGQQLEDQAPTALLGNWSIEFERGRRMENGAATIIMGTGKLAITQSGDSLLATFDMGPRPDGSRAPPSTVGGRMMPAGAVFVQKQTVEVNMNGDVQTREITLTWTLQANGDVLTGTLGRALPMRDEPLPPSPVKGKRITGSSD